MCVYVDAISFVFLFFYIFLLLLFYFCAWQPKGTGFYRSRHTDITTQKRLVLLAVRKAKHHRHMVSSCQPLVGLGSLWYFRVVLFGWLDAASVGHVLSV